VRTGSAVALYWPWFVFQDWSGFINVVNGESEPSYQNHQIATAVGYQGTRLAVVPISTNYSNIIDSSYGIFYQTAGGHLTPLIPGTATGGSGNYTQSWPDSAFPPHSLPLLTTSGLLRTV
jgi:hypothetical protein